MSEAKQRYQTAKGYRQTCRMVVNSPDRNSRTYELTTVLSLSMLIGFALELYFKAWLLDAGRPSNAVRAFGHHIRALYDEAVSDGLPAVNGLEPLVDIMVKGHEDFTFRYINDGDKIMELNWDVALGILNELDKVVDKKIGASAEHGLAPGH